MTVYLVGAGPGDPGLLTCRAAELLSVADVVLYDRLVDERILALVSPHARRIDVGKRAGELESIAQSEINELLLSCADSNDVVVRLKGGDPFLFGRGGEEIAVLREAGVAVEVVPGVSSALGVPAAAGFSLTHRGIASAVLVITGHEVARAAADWRLAASRAVTVVVLMGMAHRDAIAAALVGAGRSESTPVAVIHQGTTEREQVVVSTLGALSDVPLQSPAVIVIGEVVSLRSATVAVG